MGGKKYITRFQGPTVTKAEIAYARYRRRRAQREETAIRKAERDREKKLANGEANLPKKIERSERANTIAMKRIAQIQYFPSRLGVKMLSEIAGNEKLAIETRAEAGRVLLEIAVEGTPKRRKLKRPIG